MRINHFRVLSNRLKQQIEIGRNIFETTLMSAKVLHVDCEQLTYLSCTIIFFLPLLCDLSVPLGGMVGVVGVYSPF